MSVIRQHYILAASSDAAIALAEGVDSGRVRTMAQTEPELLALLRLHPMGYRPRPRAYRVYTGLQKPAFRLLDCIENAL